MRNPEPQASPKDGAVSKVKYRLSGHNSLSFSTCVKTLTNVTISRRGLLHLELAVGLAVFLDSGVANKSSKNMLNEIYSRAGYACAASDGKDYKTVNRRIQASAGLYGKIGKEKVQEWCKDQKENGLLRAVAHQLTQYNFASMDDVLDFIGRTSNRSSKGKEPSPFDMQVDDFTIRLPKKMNEAQLIELASKILALADSMKETQPERRLQSVPVEQERRVMH